MFILFDPESKQYWTGKYNRSNETGWNSDINKSKLFGTSPAARTCKENKKLYESLLIKWDETNEFVISGRKFERALILPVEVKIEVKNGK